MPRRRISLQWLDRMLLLATWAGFVHPGQAFGADSAQTARAVFESGAGVVVVDPQGEILEGGISGGRPMRVSGAGFEFWFERRSGGRDAGYPVSSGYPFCNGDRVALKVRSNRDLHVLALGRTIPGHPRELARYHRNGISALRQDDARRRPGEVGEEWHLLLGPGQGLKLTAGEVLGIPQDPLILSDGPGLEKLVLIVSESPIALSPYFNRSTASAAAARDRSPAPLPRAFVDELNRKIEAWVGNKAVSHATGAESESYGFQLDGSRAAAFEITLNHYPCARRLSLRSLSSELSQEQ